MPDGGGGVGWVVAVVVAAVYEYRYNMVNPVETSEGTFDDKKKVTIYTTSGHHRVIGGR